VAELRRVFEDAINPEFGKPSRRAGSFDLGNVPIAGLAKRSVDGESHPKDDATVVLRRSCDGGQTWPEMKFLFDAGRHHANLQRLAGGDLVCTLVVRDNIQDGKLASHRRGCDALTSKDHGQTWNLDRRYELDSFDYLREDGYWVDGKCGHIGAVVLDDDHVISAYGHYELGAAVLIKWKSSIDESTP